MLFPFLLTCAVPFEIPCAMMLVVLLNWFADKTIKNQLKNKYRLFIQQLTRVTGTIMLSSTIFVGRYHSTGFPSHRLSVCLSLYHYNLQIVSDTRLRIFR